MMIKAVVFDLDGVYFEDGTENFIQALTKKYGLTDQQVREVYLRSDEMQEYKRGRMTGEQFWNYAIGSWCIDTTQEELLQLLVDSYEENPQTVELISKLRKRGVKTAVCSNNFKERIDGLDQRFHLRFGFGS